jgi:hypothetical protein
MAGFIYIHTAVRLCWNPSAGLSDRMLLFCISVWIGLCLTYEIWCGLVCLGNAPASDGRSYIRWTQRLYHVLPSLISWAQLEGGIVCPSMCRQLLDMACDILSELIFQGNDPRDPCPNLFWSGFSEWPPSGSWPNSHLLREGLYHALTYVLRSAIGWYFFSYMRTQLWRIKYDRLSQPAFRVIAASSDCRIYRHWHSSHNIL